MDTPIPATATEITVAQPSPMVPAPVVQQPESLLPAIIELAKDKSVDVNKLEALLGMQAKMEGRQAEKEAIEAFARMSASLPRVKKNGTISLGKDQHGKSKGEIAFATWSDMDRVLRPALAAEGFTLSFNSAPREGGGLVVTGELMHRSGHVRSATIPLPLDQGPGRNNLQAVGSTLSYGKRYLAEMLCNIVRDDDDDGLKGGMAFITNDEADELRDLMAKTKTNEERFCGIFNVAHLGELPQANLTAARNLLLTKRDAKKAPDAARKAKAAELGFSPDHGRTS